MLRFSSCLYHQTSQSNWHSMLQSKLFMSSLPIYCMLWAPIRLCQLITDNLCSNLQVLCVTKELNNWQSMLRFSSCLYHQTSQSNWHSMLQSKLFMSSLPIYCMLWAPIRLCQLITDNLCSNLQVLCVTKELNNWQSMLRSPSRLCQLITDDLWWDLQVVCVPKLLWITDDLCSDLQVVSVSPNFCE